MGNLFHMNDFVAASQGDAQNMLGKFLYFSLSNLLVVQHFSRKYQHPPTNIFDMAPHIPGVLHFGKLSKNQ